jgi:transposase
LGNLADFLLMPGQTHDSVGVEPLIEGKEFAALLADKVFDTNAIRANLNERRALVVIPPKSNRKTPIPCDMDMYKRRHMVENFF